MDQKIAFDQLLERNRGRLVAIARSYAPREADDLLQEILLQVWRALGSFESRSSIDTWCYRVALNTAISWRRSAGLRKQRLPVEHVAIEQLAVCDRGRDQAEEPDSKPSGRGGQAHFYSADHRSDGTPAKMSQSPTDLNLVLQRFLQALSEADRALVLMYLEDMSGAEMAEVIGISEAAVRVRIHRIKKRLAQWEAGEL